MTRFRLRHHTSKRPHAACPHPHGRRPRPPSTLPTSRSPSGSGSVGWSKGRCWSRCSLLHDTLRNAVIGTRYPRSTTPRPSRRSSASSASTTSSGCSGSSSTAGTPFIGFWNFWFEDDPRFIVPLVVAVYLFPQVPRPLRPHAEHVPCDAVPHRAVLWGVFPVTPPKFMPSGTASSTPRPSSGTSCRRTRSSTTAPTARASPRPESVRVGGQPVRRDPEPPLVMGLVVHARAVARRAPATAPEPAPAVPPAHVHHGGWRRGTIGSSTSWAAWRRSRIAYGVAIAIERTLTRRRAREQDVPAHRELVP